jgi:hypothetical protein
MKHPCSTHFAVMAGLDPAIHAWATAEAARFELRRLPISGTRLCDVDGRITSGHDGRLPSEQAHPALGEP